MKSDVKKNKEKLKQLLRGYKHMNASIKHGLQELGFRVETSRTHIKIYYGNDTIRPFTVSVSASDWRTGLNMAHQLASVWNT